MSLIEILRKKETNTASGVVHDVGPSIGRMKVIGKRGMKPGQSEQCSENSHLPFRDREGDKRFRARRSCRNSFQSISPVKSL